MYKKSKYKIIGFTILLIITLVTCKKPLFKSFGTILKKHQWRKTEEVTYNSNNEFEKYTYLFENAQDCYKNSFYEFGGITDIKGNGVKYNFCADYGANFSWEIKNDSLILTPYDYDTISAKITRFIENYDKKSFILRHDTIIDGNNKKIKETFSAFEK